jgi:opacity protein-like surface antigen
MRQISFLLISICLLISGYAQADAQNFQGLRIGGNLNMKGASTKLSDSSGQIGTFGGNNIGGGITVAVSQRISNKVIIGVGASFSNSKFKSGTADIVEIKGKNLWTAFVEPGVVVGENTLLYGKAGYAGMKGSVDEFNTAYTFKGYVYGLGIRTMVVDSLYVEVEALQYKFNSKEIEGMTFETKATSANVGVGYIFN